MVIEALLKAELSVEADTVHSDTQGQSAAVFAFTYLHGIKLMPRIRNWKDLKLYRPDRSAKYKHIDRLFREVVDWNLIEESWQELMQVTLSVQAGKISSPTLLRKLGSHSRKNRLAIAAHELGNVIRTVYLLKWIGDRRLRQDVTGTTNKMEAYNGFAKYLSFGGDVIPVNEPEEQQKRLRYNDLIASSLILQNTVDMIRVLQQMKDQGARISDEDVARLSPFAVDHMKRFGDYNMKLKRPPEPWIREPMFQQAVNDARGARRRRPTMARAA